MSTQFVLMYHPLIAATITKPVLVPLQAVDDYMATGWLLVDPDAPEPPAPATPYYTTAAADSRFVQDTQLGTKMAGHVGDGSAFDLAQRAAFAAAIPPSATVYESQAQHNRNVLYQHGSTVYGAAQSGTATVSRSDDFGATWTTKGTVPAPVRALIRIEGTGTLIAACENGAVYRSVDDGTNWALSVTLNFPPLRTFTATPSGYILIGEYGTVGNTVYRIMRSADDGLTFTAVYSSSGTDPQGDPGHIHAITYDTYQSCFVAFSDRPIVSGVSGPKILRSNDEGGTWTVIGEAKDPAWPNFVAPMYFPNHIAWAADNQLNGRILRIGRDDFYAGNFAASEVVATVNRKAGYYAFPVRSDVWAVSTATEVISPGAEPLAPGSYAHEVYLVSDEGGSVTGGFEAQVPQTRVGTLAGLKAFFPAYDPQTLDHGGRAWVNLPSTTTDYGYTAMPFTAGWSPPAKRVQVPALGGYRKIASGLWYGPANHTPGAAVASAGILTALPFWVPEAFTADRIACEVTVAATGATVRLGIYDSSIADGPNQCVLDAGTVDAAITGVREAPISYTFRPGLYWLAAVAQGGNPTLRNIGNGSLPPVGVDGFIGSTASAGMNGYYMPGVIGALPQWAGGGATPGSYKVMVRAR